MSSIGLGATLNVAKPKKGSTVAVFGLGAVGLAVSLSYLLMQMTYLIWLFFGITTAALLFLVKIYINTHTHMILWFYVIRLLKGLELRVLQGLSVLI